VREGGFEPPRPFGHRILNPARLPGSATLASVSAASGHRNSGARPSPFHRHHASPAGRGLELSHPAVDVTIIGARRPSHLGETVAAADMKLSERDRQEIDRMLANAAPVVGPSPEVM
jgi:hypothetical protein